MTTSEAVTRKTGSSKRKEGGADPMLCTVNELDLSGCIIILYCLEDMITMGLVIDDPQNDKEVHNEWLTSEYWPPPKWLKDSSSNQQINDYATFLTHAMRARYLELESDFRSVFGNFIRKEIVGVDIVTAERIVDLLRSSREVLQKTVPNLLTVSIMLDLVERYMIWIYPYHLIVARVPRICSQIDDLERADKERLRALVQSLASEGQESFGQLRAVFDEVIGAWNEQRKQKEISNGLQIERLKSLILWGFILLIIFLMACPLIVNSDSLGKWPLTVSLAGKVNPTAWLAAIGVSLMGAVGGFLSGLLQIRRSQVGLAQYQESMLNLLLKPLVGSIAAVVLFVLLSWQILPGIDVKSAGTYVCLAFISGFSERYFLKLLDIKLDDNNAQAQIANSKGAESISSNDTKSEG